LGWREWAALPELGIARIKAKIDTGARTSALHAFYLEPYTDKGIRMVRFGIHPLQRDTETEKHCTAVVSDERRVTDSGGHPERRLVIETPVVIGEVRRSVEITLTNRDTMNFRMLLGRTAMRKVFRVDPALSYAAGEPRIKSEE
jgi:hypothetical protein